MVGLCIMSKKGESCSIMVGSCIMSKKGESCSMYGRFMYHE